MASSTLSAANPRGTGTPNFPRTAFAWYSWIFMRSPGRCWAGLLAECRRDFGAGLDQRAHCGHRLVKHLAFGAVELQFHHALDALRTDHHRHADIEILHAVLAVEIGGAGQHAFLVLQIAFRHR